MWQLLLEKGFGHSQQYSAINTAVDYKCVHLTALSDKKSEINLITKWTRCVFTGTGEVHI